MVRVESRNRFVGVRGWHRILHQLNTLLVGNRLLFKPSFRGLRGCRDSDLAQAIPSLIQTSYNSSNNNSNKSLGGFHLARQILLQLTGLGLMHVVIIRQEPETMAILRAESYNCTE